MLFLILYEIISYESSEIEEVISVDIGREEMMIISLDIILHELTCSGISNIFNSFFNTNLKKRCQS